MDTPSPASWLREHLARRARLAGPLQAYRILHGEIDGAPPHWAVDRIGDALVFRAPDEASVGAQADFPRRFMEAAEVSTAVLKVREGHASRVLAGPVRERSTIQEGPARLEVRLDDGYQIGLFVEGRGLRDRLTQDQMQGEVLSLFSYTGSASVRAALAGARVTSVDASRRAHAWARTNFALSGVEPDAHRWFVDDAMTILRRSAEKAWDGLILDPPAFGRHKRRTFKLDRDLAELAEHALRCARRIYFSTHAPELDERSLKAVWKAAAGRRQGSWSWKRIPNHFDLPEGGADWGRYHRAYVIEVGG